MKKKAKTQKTKTTAAKAKATKASTTTKTARGAKPKTKAATSGKAPRTTTERKQPKRGAQKADTKTAEPVAETALVNAPVLAIAEEETSPAAPSTTNETGPATAESPKAATTKRALAKEKPETSDSRLPPVGTVLQKRDRHGAVRCECEITAEGIRYQGELYRSLSAAAVAAAKELGLAAKAINGFTFWGLAKPARPAADPLTALERAWDRYATKVESVLEGAKGSEEGREPVLSALERHARVLKNLHDEVA